MWKWQNVLCSQQVHSSISTVWLHVTPEYNFSYSQLGTIYGRHMLGWDIHSKPKEKWALSFTPLKGLLGKVTTEPVWILLKVLSHKSCFLKCPREPQASWNLPASSKRHLDV